MKMQRNGFQHTDKNLSRVGLGGEGVLRTQGMEPQAKAVIETAADSGITYFDSARVYMDSELYYGGYWRENPDARKDIFQTSKSAQRTREGALKDLNQTLDRLNTDTLDLWQIHDVRDERDLDLISGKGGALEAFVAAREEGMVKHIGVTGHHDPEILTRALTLWPVDAVLMPVNPVEAVIGGFLTHTLDAAHKKGIAVIAMKVLGGRHYISEEAGITADLLIRFALSHDITLAIVGCSTPDEVKGLVRAGEHPEALGPEEQKALITAFQPVARRLAFYRGRL